MHFLIVDDSAPACQSLRRLIEFRLAWCVIAEAVDSQETVEQALAHGSQRPAGGAGPPARAAGPGHAGPGDGEPRIGRKTRIPLGLICGFLGIRGSYPPTTQRPTGTLPLLEEGSDEAA